ncbi:MAG: TonB-dependent receptor [Spirosomaceae bacterium]|nr:TonB-dependent receptor [Spirosomataceae bacterium]
MSQGVVSIPWKSISDKIVTASLQQPAPFQLDIGQPKNSIHTAAAVMILLISEHGNYRVVLTERHKTLTHHPGQISLVGGRIDLNESAWEAALRETEEEINLSRLHIRRCGFLPHYHTVSGFMILLIDNNMPNLSLSTAILVLLPFGLLAQTSTLTGDVRTPDQKVIEGVVVSLLSAKDSAFVKAAITENEGIYTFQNIKAGSYLLMMTHVGFDKYLGAPFEVAKPTVALPTVVLRPASQQLEEVKVRAQKPFVERKIDRVVVNPDALISNAGANALEILEKSPGVQVDINGNISLRGQAGVAVFIDDKPTNLSAADLANFLRTLNSSTVESVEIMTNPPAKYDAAGNAGIINIRLKRNTVKGWSGGLTLSAGQGFYSRSNNSANFNYRINKLNFFSSASYNINNTYQDLTITRGYFTPTGAPLSGFVQNNFIKRELRSRNVKVGVDFYPNKKTTIGAAVTGFVNPTLTINNNRAQILTATNQIQNLVDAFNPADRTWRNLGINLNYTYKIDAKGKEISANADYLRYDLSSSQVLTNEVFTPTRQLLNRTILESDLPTTIDIRTAKIDYLQPVGKGGRFESGLKTSAIATTNVADFYDRVDNVRRPNYEFSNNFEYTENIQAAYVNYNRNFKKLSVQAGLRFESTNILGNQLGNIVVKDSVFKRQYNNLFPTLYLSYALDSARAHQLGFSYGRRIERPNYQSMNPFTYPMDRFTYYAGNSFLQPTFSDNLELTYTYNNAVTFTLQGGVARDVILESIEQVSNIFYSRPGNFGRKEFYGLTVNGGWPIAKWWTLQVYTEVIRNTFKANLYNQKLDLSRWHWVLMPTNVFQIGKTWNAELAGSYQTRILVGQFIVIPVWTVRAGVSKKILKGAGSLKLAVSDVFYTQQPGGDIQAIANSTASWLSFLDSRVATLTFSWRFAKGQNLRLRQTGGADSEKGRVGN